MIENIIASYSIFPVAAFLVAVILLNKILHFLVFKIPAVQKTRDINREKDVVKLAKPDYPPAAKATRKAGATVNLIFVVLIAPFVLTLDVMPWWRYPLDIFLILMVYDFFYYLTHRFLFHGKSFLRQVHGFHHRARNPTYIDAFYVHRIENYIGVGLYVGTVGGIGIFFGGIHALSTALAFVIWSNLNTLNHVEVDLPYFPFRIVNYLTDKHQVHHENMHMGNYGSITPFYDAIFGTLD